MVTQADLDSGLIGQITANSIAGAKIGAEGYQAQKERDAKLAQLIKGSELKKQALIDNLRIAKENAGPNQVVSGASDDAIHFGQVDTLDKALKHAQLQNAQDDRQDRIQGRESNMAQTYYGNQGGKDYAQKANTLKKAYDLYQKGDPESQRIAELELAQGAAKNALTQQEFGALTNSHGVGASMQAGAKGMSQAVRNLVPSVLGGDRLADFLGKRADSMNVLTPQEMESKKALIKRLYDENKASADAIQAEMTQRAPQLMPSTYRRNPNAMKNVMDSLGARISDISPDGSNANQAPPAGRERQAQQPQGDSRPKTVQQNGHTYTLNPATGQYE
jgi:hypothetical protein